MIRYLNLQISEKYRIFGLVLVLIAGIYFRLVNLGYSQLQSDEVDVLYYLVNKKTFVDFLLTQKKGPGQYLIAYLLEKFIHNFTYLELVQRIPFAIAGIATLVLAYFLAKKVLGKAAAICATLFIGMSGLVIALSRYVQFPPFIMMFSCISIYLILKTLEDKNKNVKLIFLNGVSSGLALLFHYDALAFILAIGIVLLISRKFKELLIYSGVIVIIASLFYVPFMLHSSFANTLDFLIKNRIYSGNNNSFDITYQVLVLYHSREFLIVVLIGLLLWLYSFAKTINKFNALLLFFALLSIICRYFYTNIYTYYLINSLFGLFFAGYLFWLYSQKTLRLVNVIEIWFFVSFISYIAIIKFPLTHIYNFFIPMLILIAGEYVRLIRKTPQIGLPIILIFVVSCLSFNYQVFADTNVEYPWKEKSYIFGKMYNGVQNNEKVRGIFGLSYNRNWKEISKNINFLAQTYNVRKYSTNERAGISRFYLSYEPPIYSYNPTSPEIYIKIKDPYSMIKAPKIRSSSLFKNSTYEIYLVSSTRYLEDDEDSKEQLIDE